MLQYCLDKGNARDMIYPDFSKIFDMVTHSSDGELAQEVSDE